MVTVRFSDGKGWLTAQASAWSASEVFLATAQIFPPGTELSLVVTPPGDRRPTILSARVRSASIAGTSGMQVELFDVSESSRRALERLTGDAPRRPRVRPR